MAYTALTFVGGEVLTATKMNLLGANDAGFNNGTALADSIILPRHLSAGAVTASKVDFTTFGTADANGWKNMGAYWVKNYSISATTIAVDGGMNIATVDRPVGVSSTAPVYPSAGYLFSSRIVVSMASSTVLQAYNSGSTSNNIQSGAYISVVCYK